MNSWLKRLLSMLLALSIAVSCFAVLASAEDTEDGEQTEDGGELEPVVVYNRDFQDGWGIYNGFGVETTMKKKHNFLIDKEVTADYGYNYFARFEAADTYPIVNAKTGRDGFAQLSFEKLGYPSSQHVFVEFDIKIDDLCNLGQIIYMRTQGGSSEGTQVSLVSIKDERLYVLPDHFKTQEGVPLRSDWHHVTLELDYTDPELDPTTHFIVRMTVDDGEPFEITVQARTNDRTGIDIIRFGLPQANDPELSSSRAGQSWCLDNLAAYYNTDRKLTEAELDAQGYGVNVDVNQIKTIVIDGSMAQKGTWDYLEESLSMKVGTPLALVNNQQVDLSTIENAGKPVEIDGKIYVSLEAILKYLNTGVKYEDNMTYAISVGTGVSYVTVGRTLATINGKVVELTAAPGVYTDPESGDKYPVIAMEDIETVFPGYYVTYDNMGLIIICQLDNILNRDTNLADMLVLMDRFVYNFIDEEEVYERAKEMTNNFTHPYLFGGQEVYDRMIAIYDGTDTTDYGVDLKTGITSQVNRAYNFYMHFAKPAGLEPALDENGVQLRGKNNYPLYLDENGEPTLYADAAPYGGLNLHHPDLETLKFPHLATNGYDPAGGRQAESGTVTNWAHDIAFGYIITEDIGLAQLTYDILVAVGEWDHWCPGHFLNCADAAQKYSMALDWVYQGILSLQRGEFDEELGESVGKLPSKYYKVEYVEKLLYKNGLRMGYLVSNRQYHGHYRPQGDVCYYTTMANNWNAVCTAGMWLSALTLMGSEAMGELGDGEGEQAYSKTAAWLVANNLETLALNGMRQYAPDGSYVESPGYWGYGTNSMYLGLMSLWRCLGDDFGYLDAAGMDKTCYFACHIESSEYRTFSYHDGGVGTVDSSSFLFVAEAMNDPVLREIRLLHLKNGKSMSIRDYLYFPYESFDDEVDVELELDYYMEGIEAFVTRSSWEKGALYAGIIAGMNNASHGQVDSGTFIYYNAGKIWLQDIGSDNYNIYGYFGGQNGAPANTRYRYYRMNAEGHNTVAITSKPDKIPFGQVLTAGGTISDWFSNEYGSYAILDQTDVYGGYANFAKRGMMLTNDRKTLVIQDEIALDGVETLYWFAHFDMSNIEYEIAPNGRTMYLHWINRSSGRVEMTLRLSIVSRNAYEKFTVTTAGETEEDRLLKGDMGTVDYAFSKANGALDSEKSRASLRRIAIRAHTNILNFAVCIELIEDKNDPLGYSTIVPMEEWVPSKGIIKDESGKENLRGNPNLKSIRSEVNGIQQMIDLDRHLTVRLAAFYLALTNVHYIEINFYPEELVPYEDELEQYHNAKAIYDTFANTINTTVDTTRIISQTLMGV